MFDFKKCRDWVVEESGRLKAADFRVTVAEADTPSRVVRIRLEGDKATGEIVVWEDGKTNIMLYNLRSQKFIIDQHDKVLVGGDYETLRDFFARAIKYR